MEVIKINNSTKISKMDKKIKSQVSIFTLLFFSVSFSFAQESNIISLSLQQCVQMAVEENVNIKTAQIDRQKNQYKKAEAISAIIPKISVGANFQDNLMLPTTMLPAEFGVLVGTP